jgi:hypothetical protein
MAIDTFKISLLCLFPFHQVLVGYLSENVTDSKTVLTIQKKIIM